jgi:hypothetical protein
LDGESSTALDSALLSGNINDGSLAPSNGKFHTMTTYWATSSSGVFSFDYGSTQTLSSEIPTSKLNVGFGITGSATAKGDVQWIRIRAYPPSGVMPGASFGSVV